MLHPHEQYGRQILDMISSLQNSVIAALGDPNWDRLKKLTVEEFVLLMASNGIRFHYIGSDLDFKKSHFKEFEEKEQEEEIEQIKTCWQCKEPNVPLDSYSALCAVCNERKVREV